MLLLLRVPNAGAREGAGPELSVVRGRPGAEAGVPLRAHAVAVGRGVPVGEESSLLHSRRPRTGGVVLDLADLSDEALEILRTFAEAR